MRLIVLFGLLLVGCGQTSEDRDTSTGGDGPLPTGGSGAIDGGAAGSGGSLDPTGGGAGATPGCTPVGDAALRALLPRCGEGCRGAATFVVRLDYQSLEILGWHAAGGEERPVDEASARATAIAATGLGYDSDQLQLKSEDLFVFYRSPGDFGGVAMTSAIFDVPLFGGEIVWSGRGSITYPLDWEPAESLGSGCGFDASLLPDDEPQRSAAERVGDTALPHAFPDGLRGLTVYEYTPTVGDTDYAVAEWLVFVTGYGPAGV